MFFRHRRRSGSDPLVRVRLATLILGGVLGLIGMRFDNAVLVNVAIGLVLVGFLLRFVPHGDSDADAKDREVRGP